MSMKSKSSGPFSETTRPLGPASSDTTRSSEQNAKMWAMLTEVSQQVTWHGQKLAKDEWKDVFTAAIKRQKVVPGIDGGFVVIGARTHKMSIQEMSELMELMLAFGAQQGVEFKDGATT